MMKLFAFRDQFEDAEKGNGRYHAVDLYTVLATTTETEWKQALGLRDRYREDAMIVEAGTIIRDYFSSETSPGVLRLKESPYYSKDLEIDAFISTLRELFPTAENG